MGWILASWAGFWLAGASWAGFRHPGVSWAEFWPPGASWAGFWLPGASWAGFRAAGASRSLWTAWDSFGNALLTLFVVLPLIFATGR